MFRVLVDVVWVLSLVSSGLFRLGAEALKFGVIVWVMVLGGKWRGILIIE